MSNILDSPSHSPQFELLLRRQQTKIDYLLEQNEILHRLNDQLTTTLQGYREHILPINFQTEISQLQKNNQDLHQDLNTAQSTALLNKQVSQQLEGFYSEVLQEYEDKIQELRRIIHEKEYNMQELEKSKPIIEQDGVIIKCKDLVPFTEFSLKYHTEMEHMQQMLSKITSQLQQQQTIQNTLQQENQIYRFELRKIQHALQNQVNYSKVKSQDVYSSDTEMVIPIKQTISQSETRQYVSFCTPKNNEAERFKRLFERELMNNKILLSENQALGRHMIQLQENNERLLNSIKQQSHKISKLSESQQYLEQFWQAFLQSNGQGEFKDPEEFIKYKLINQEQPHTRQHSQPQLKYVVNQELQEYKGYLLQMHRNIHTVKDMKILIPRTMSQPSRMRKMILEKKMKKCKVELSIISQKKKTQDISFMSEYIF